MDELLLQVYELCAIGQTQKAMETLYVEAQGLATAGCRKDLGILMDTFDINKCPIIVGVGLLRLCWNVPHLYSNVELYQRLDEHRDCTPHMLRGMGLS